MALLSQDLQDRINVGLDWMLANVTYDNRTVTDDGNGYVYKQGNNVSMVARFVNNPNQFSGGDIWTVMEEQGGWANVAKNGYEDFPEYLVVKFQYLYCKGENWTPTGISAIGQEIIDNIRVEITEDYY